MSLRVENLTVYYQTLQGDVQALESATFTIADGEIMGLVGESGCGKTTLGHSLIRLVAPMRFIKGSVTLAGEELPVWDMERMNRFRFRKISIIPQYAMNALNPTRKIGKMTSELLESRQVDRADVALHHMATRPQQALGDGLVGGDSDVALLLFCPGDGVDDHPQAGQPVVAHTHMDQASVVGHLERLVWRRHLVFADGVVHITPCNAAHQ